MKNVKAILTYILVICLTVFFVAYYIVNMISSSILNEKYLLSKLSEINYYQKVYNQVQLNFENYIKQSALEEDVIKDIVTYDKVEEDTEKIIKNLLSGAEKEITTQEISDKLNENIKKSLQDRKISNDEEESIKKFVDIICNEYKSTILHTDYEKSINNNVSNIIKKIKSFNKILLVGVGAPFVLILLVNIRKFYKFVNAIGISATASGLVFLVASIFVNKSINIEEITLLNSEFSEFLRTILSEIITNIRLTGIVFAVLGVVMIILSNLIHNIRKYGVKERVE